VVQVLGCLVASAILAMLISAAVSSLFRSTAIATTVAYGVLIALFGGTMLVWVNRDAPFGHGMVENTLRLNPMAAALNAMQAQGFTSYNLLPSAWYVAGVSSVLLLILLFVQTLRLTRPD
jgi:ABC-type polysaccharide/polyol phosphate export permease